MVTWITKSLEERCVAESRRKGGARCPRTEKGMSSTVAPRDLKQRPSTALTSVDWLTRLAASTVYCLVVCIHHAWLRMILFPSLIFYRSMEISSRAREALVHIRDASRPFHVLRQVPAPKQKTVTMSRSQ